MSRFHLILALGLAASPAAAFVARNDLVVEPQADGTIHVPWRGESGATAFWCAAADYAARRLGASPSDRLYRVSKLPRGQGEGITFSLTPPEAPIPPSFVAGQTGEMSIALAKSYCEPIGPFHDLFD